MSGVPHGEFGLGGPGMWTILGVMALAAVAAAAVLLDVVRRPDRPVGLARRLLWGAPQAAYAAAFAYGMAVSGAGQSSLAILVTLPVALAAQIAYVFRVVSPRRGKVAVTTGTETPDRIRPDEGSP